MWGGVFLEGVSANRLCRLQDKIIFNLFALDYDVRINVKTIYKRHGILQFSDLYKIQLCNLIFKVLNENYASFLGDSLREYTREHHYDIRHQNDFDIPFPHVRSVKYNFLYQGIELWNELPANLKGLPNSRCFKSSYKEYLLNQY